MDLNLSYEGWTIPMKSSASGADGGLALSGTATKSGSKVGIDMKLVPSGGEHSIVTIRLGGRREYGIFGLTLHRSDTQGLAKYSNGAFSVGDFQNITGIEAQMMRRMFAIMNMKEHVADALSYDKMQRAENSPPPRPSQGDTPPTPQPRPSEELQRIQREFGKVRCPMLCNH